MNGVDTQEIRMRRSRVGECAAVAMSKLWGRWMMKVVTLTPALRPPHRRAFGLMLLSSNQPCRDPI